MKNILLILVKTLAMFALFVLSAQALYTYNGGLTVLKNPLFAGLLALVLVFLFLKQSLSFRIKNELQRKLESPLGLASKGEKQEKTSWLKTTYKKLLGSKPIEQEHEIILDHNYDGIRELDNNLPPWWIYSFYISIIFAVIYLTRYHVLGADNQDTELKKEYAAADISIAAYKKTAKDLVDFENVTLLTNQSDINAGKEIYQSNCVACHKADGGGGIGPNLTDKHWILGGGIKNVFKTISEGGRDGKGMVSWKSSFKPSQIAQVSSYVLSLQGTTPAAPKEPQGDLWSDNDTTKANTTTKASTTEEPVKEEAITAIKTLTSKEDLAAGEKIYKANCAACHKADGGGLVGPNLTDKHWILGGGMENISKTIADGGRKGKGMIPWKGSLKPEQIAQVSSYVLKFQGTTPGAGAKAAEGEIWKE